MRRLTISVPVLDAVRAAELAGVALFCLAVAATLGPSGDATLRSEGLHLAAVVLLGGLLAFSAATAWRRCAAVAACVTGAAGLLLCGAAVADAQAGLGAGARAGVALAVWAAAAACVASWWRGGRGRFLLTVACGAVALASAGLLLASARAWELQWWAAHLGLAAAAGLLLAGTTRERARRGSLDGDGELVSLASMAQQIVDEMSEALAVFDEHGTVVGWNRAACEVTGWDRDEAQQRVPANTPEGLVPLGAGRWVRAHGFEMCRSGERFRGLLFRDATEEVRTLEAREQLEQRVQERTAEVERMQLEILARLAQAAELRDDDTGQHTRRVGRLAGLIAGELGLPAEQCDLIRRAAPLHDLGKIGVPDALLLKPGKLTDEEFEQIKAHATIGGQLLDAAGFDLARMAQQIALTHHERWDGNGYPQGLRGHEIPLAGRIVAVADVFDALTNERPYKEAWPLEDAVAEIARQSGAQLDRDCVAAFLRIVARGGIEERRPDPPPRFTSARVTP
jgi:hypothetical protein